MWLSILYKVLSTSMLGTPLHFPGFVLPWHSTPCEFFFHRLRPSPLGGSKRLNWAATQSGWVKKLVVCIVYFTDFPHSVGPVWITVAILDVLSNFSLFFSSLSFRTPRVRGNTLTANSSHQQCHAWKIFSVLIRFLFGILLPISGRNQCRALHLY